MTRAGRIPIQSERLFAKAAFDRSSLWSGGDPRESVNQNTLTADTT